MCGRESRWNRRGCGSELAERRGAGKTDARIWGTYLHGLFDADAFRRWFIDRLRVRRGLPPMGKIIGQYDIEPALDRLAETVRASVRMEEVYKLLRLA